MSTTRCLRARAPAKAILLGEHAVNRGQTALAVSVGLYATCELTCPVSGKGYELVADAHQETTTRDEILAFGRLISSYRQEANYHAIQQLAADDFFAPAKYVLAALDERLPTALQLTFRSEIPPSAGLGSGGATFTALAAGLARLLVAEADDDMRTVEIQRQIAAWAVRGDIIAHGGIASGLDTQTSLYGGAIQYTAEREGEPISWSRGLTLVIGNTHVFAATSAVNGRVRNWLAEKAVRLHYFQEIGVLSRHAQEALRVGNWSELGQLLNLNQLLLERIGVSCPELEALNEAALAAGALGAKLSGSGGGGIMIALTPSEKVEAVAHAIEACGGTAIVAPIGVPGVQVEEIAIGK